MVWEALDDPEKYVILQTAPAVRVSIGEPFGIPIGVSTGKMVAAFVAGTMQFLSILLQI